MRFIQFLVEQDDWDESPSNMTDDEVSHKLNGLHHQADLLYKEVLKLTDPYRCARLRPMDQFLGGAKGSGSLEGYLYIPMCYEGDPLSPQFIEVHTDKLPSRDRIIIQRIGAKMHHIYLEQQRLGEILLRDYPGEPEHF